MAIFTLILFILLAVSIFSLIIACHAKSKIFELEEQIYKIKKYLIELEKSSSTNDQLTKPSQLTQTKANEHQLLTATQPPTVIQQSTKKEEVQPQQTDHCVILESEKTPEIGVFKRFTNWLLAGNPVAKIGIVILFFGLSYLFKYSIEHALLSPEIRILGAICIGVTLLIFGWILRTKEEKTLFALILQGGAIGTLYLTIFAAFKLYAMIPMLLSFGLILTICFISIVFSVRQRAISLAILACVGGYLAPILLSTSSGNHIALFSYYLAISSTILIISIWQSWRRLNLIGLLFTFVIAVLWGSANFRPEYYIECQIFIVANMLIYGIIAVLTSVRSIKKEQYQSTIDLILLFSVPLLAFTLQYAIVKQYEFGTAFSSLGFGLFYLLGAMMTLCLWHKDAKQIAIYGLAIGIGFSSLAVPLALAAVWTSLIWLFEGTVVTWAALKTARSRFALIGTILSSLGFLFAFYSKVENLPDTTLVTLYGITSGLLLFNAILWHHYQKINPSLSTIIKSYFIGCTVLSWVIWILNGVFRLVKTSENIIPSIVLCFTIAVWIWCFIGRRLKWQLLNHSIITLWPVLILAFIISALFNGKMSAFNYLGSLCWIAAFISAYCYLYINQSQLNSTKTLTKLLHISLVWLVLIWLHYELTSLLSHYFFSHSLIKYSVLMTAASAIMLLFYHLQKRNAFPLAQLSELYWLIGLLPLSAYLFFGILSGLSYHGQIANLFYIPILNPIELSSVFTLLMLSVYFAIVSKHHSKQGGLSLLGLSIMIILLFLFGNSIILRSLSYWLTIPWHFESLWHSKTVQVVLSLIWAFIAVVIVVIANRYLKRNIWFIGVLLQAVVIIKLFFVDSVTLDGLIRALAFIGVSVFMLTIGYLAPLPPKQNQLPQKDQLS